MWVVVYLWNNNGMASWCWEASHALFERGESVLLVCSSSAPLPGPTTIPLLRFDATTRKLGVFGKIVREMRRLSTRPTSLLSELHAELMRKGHAPDAYLLNSTEFVNPAIPVPQFVVGWAYPTSLAGYAKKVTLYSRPSLSRQFIRSALSTLGWYRKDWSAYRRATGVMSVSRRLDRELRENGVHSSVVHPGTSLSLPRDVDRPPKPADEPFRLLIVAAELDDPRKRVGWMIDALAGGKRRDFKLLLIGDASDKLRQRIVNSGLEAHFLGRVTRDQVQEHMRGQDVFLFGSQLDDWGYVLVEAMSQGLAVVAPDLSPFDEIMGDSAGASYCAADPVSFRDAVYTVANSNLGRYRAAAFARAREQFSRDAFATALLLAVGRSDRKAESAVLS